MPGAPEPEGAEPSLFGRDIDDIIADYLQPGGRLGETELEKDVRDAMPAIIDQIGDVDLTDEVFAQMREALDAAVHLDARMPFQWVMFAEPTENGSEFVGAYVTQAMSFEQAVFIISVRGDVPGGRADGAALPVGMPVDPDWCDRLLNYPEAIRLRDIIDAQTN